MHALLFARSKRLRHCRPTASIHLPDPASDPRTLAVRQQRQRADGTECGPLPAAVLFRRAVLYRCLEYDFRAGRVLGDVEGEPVDRRGVCLGQSVVQTDKCGVDGFYGSGVGG